MKLKLIHMGTSARGLIIILVFAFPALAFGQAKKFRKIDPAQETTVSKVAVAKIVPERREKPPVNLDELQQAIVKVLNERSYVDASVFNQALSPEDDAKKVVALMKTAKEQTADSTLAVLTGEIKDDALKMSLRSGLTGRSLVRWNFPIAAAGKDKTKAASLLQNVVDTIVRDFPYRGYIMFSKGENVQLNLGSRHAIRPGVRLSVFEFEGSKPTFSSPRTSLGEVVITKVSANLAIGKIKSQVAAIKKFAKVDIFVAQIANIQEHEVRYARKAWVATGLDFQFLDTQTPDTPIVMKQRRYKLTLSPFLRVGAGYGRLAAFVSYGSASNESNDVKFLMSQVSAEVIQADLGEDTSMITSGGLTYSSYSSSQKPGAVAPLASVTNYSGLIEQAIHYKVTSSTRFFGYGHLLYPYFSSDPENKEAKAFTSFAFGVGGGLRIYLFPNFAVESQIMTRMSNWTLSEGSIQEIQYGLSLQGIYFF
ncbi:MAG TPA: hypothetical protein VFV50_19785 [Bdellovibrionales bacterium]|nr:hypothetical protein [Bdellovibrionales bacterium]